MRIHCLLLAILIALQTSATTYIFSGNGDWNTAANWQGGLVPPNPTGANTIIISGNATRALNQLELSSGSTLSVTGILTLRCDVIMSPTATLNVENGATCNFEHYNSGFFSEVRLWFYGATININNGGVVNFKATVRDKGNLNVNGTLNNTGSIYAQGGGGTSASFVVNGVFTHQGSGALFILDIPMTINNGGTFANSSLFFNCNVLTINQGGTFTNNGTVGCNGTMVMNRFMNGGIISPGLSPGTITITGDYEPTSTATHNFEIGGTAVNSFDRINISGNAILNGTLNVSLINSFTPSGTHDIVIFSASSITGTFSSVNLPAGYTLIYNSNNVTLRYGSVLPVGLSNFKASLIRPAKALLTWTTSFEQDNQGFEIQHSLNGRDWHNAGFVPTQGNSVSSRIYSFEFANMQKGINYFRLKQVDYNGRVEYSQIINVNLTEPVNLFFSNVVKNEIIFSSSKTGIVQIFDITGRNVLNKKITSEKVIQLHNINPGSYVLVITNRNGIVERQKFQVAN